MSFVEDTLTKDPKIRLDDLFQRAREVSASIKDLSKRQFNARYPLQVKRKRSQAARKKAGSRTRTQATSRARVRAKTRKKGTESREAVRGVFLQFATDIAGAEERKDLVKVLADVDRYVDQVIKSLN